MSEFLVGWAIVFFAVCAVIAVTGVISMGMEKLYNIFGFVPSLLFGVLVASGALAALGVFLF